MCDSVVNCPIIIALWANVKPAGGERKFSETLDNAKNRTKMGHSVRERTEKMLHDGPLFSGENCQELSYMLSRHEHPFTKKMFHLLLERLREQERMLNDLRSRVVQNGVYDVTDEEKEDTFIRKTQTKSITIPAVQFKKSI